VVFLTWWSAITNSMLAWHTSSVASIKRSSGRVTGSPGGNTPAGSNFAIFTEAKGGIGEPCEMSLGWAATYSCRRQVAARTTRVEARSL
jgi:hypothetical protein